MEEIDRRVIQLYIEELSTDTKFTLLWNELMSNNEHKIITPNLKKKYLQLLDKRTSNYTLNKMLYEDLQTRGSKAFSILIQCLRKVHPDLAELLLPSESVTAVQEESLEEFETLQEISQVKGYCITAGDDKATEVIYNAVKNLCKAINAKLINDVEDAEWNDGMTFELIINMTNDVSEDIKNLRAEHSLPENIKLIIINIINEQMDKQSSSSNNSSSTCNGGNLFNVNIYIHPDDHRGSILYIIKEVIANNPGYDIRDIFHVVLEKLEDRGCTLTTESRSFPKFSFNPST